MENYAESRAPGSGKLSDIDRIVGELYVKHRGDVLRFVRSELKGMTEDQAEDLVPHVFLKLTKRYQEGNPPTDCKNWLFEVARNEGLEILRKEGIREAASLGADGIPSDVVDRDQRGVESKIISGEVKAVTREALLGLPELPRKVVEMHLAGSTYVEIAAALAMTDARAERICLDAMRSIQDRLGAMWSSMVREADSRDYTPTTRAKMIEALEKLGKRYAALLLLRYDEGLDVRRIVARLDSPAESVERDLARAHELLERRFSLTGDGLAAILRKPA
jgi:RNA polymerase sigma factor (sigma-70 family)